MAALAKKSQTHKLRESERYELLYLGHIEVRVDVKLERVFPLLTIECQDVIVLKLLRRVVEEYV
jgi:hypothetical protein